MPKPHDRSRFEKWVNDEYKCLLGGTVKQIILDDGGGEQWYGLLIEKDGRNYCLWFWRDPEGNGPGHADCYPYEGMAEYTREGDPDEEN